MSSNRFGDKSGSKEQDAREQAYQEYLELRNRNSKRGNYIKDDSKYGSYFANNTDRNGAQGRGVEEHSLWELQHAQTEQRGSPA